MSDKKVTISFAKNRAPIQLPAGANLMQGLLDAGVPVASSCNGKGVCVKCVVEVKAGAENFAKETQDEKDLREIHDIPKNVRLSCQTSVLGDVTLDTKYW